jgi:hypothetical protein
MFKTKNQVERVETITGGNKVATLFLLLYSLFRVSLPPCHLATNPNEQNEKRS